MYILPLLAESVLGVQVFAAALPLSCMRVDDVLMLFSDWSANRSFGEIPRCLGICGGGAVNTMAIRIHHLHYNGTTYIKGLHSLSQTCMGAVGECVHPIM